MGWAILTGIVDKYLSEHLGGLAFLSAFGSNPRSTEGKVAEGTQKSGSNNFRIGSKSNVYWLRRTLKIKNPNDNKEIPAPTANARI